MYKGYYNGAHQWSCSNLGEQYTYTSGTCSVPDISVYGERIIYLVTNSREEIEIARTRDKLTPESLLEIANKNYRTGVESIRARLTYTTSREEGYGPVTYSGYTYVSNYRTVCGESYEKYEDCVNAAPGRTFCHSCQNTRTVYDTHTRTYECSVN